MASRVRSFLVRAGLLLTLWWALAEGDGSGWAFALGTILTATLVSLAVHPPPAWRLGWRSLLPFLGFFLRQMLLGGMDVARRALHPSLPLSPGFLSYPLRLDRPAARLLMAWTTGLLPGTVSVELRGEVLQVHALDTSMPVAATLTALEERIAPLFGGVQGDRGAASQR